jgi:hypothetical protein
MRKIKKCSIMVKNGDWSILIAAAQAAISNKDQSQGGAGSVDQR